MKVELKVPESVTEPRLWVQHQQVLAMVLRPGSVEWGLRAGWRFEFLGIRSGLPANWHAGKKRSSNDEKSRSFTETLLNRRTWIEILAAANKSCQGCGGRHFSDNLYP